MGRMEAGLSPTQASLRPTAVLFLHSILNNMAEVSQHQRMGVIPLTLVVPGIEPRDLTC